MEFIGIDLGTTGICGVIIDAESGKVLKSKTVESNAFIKTQSKWEKIQSVEKIISIAFEITESLLNENTVSIGVTGQMHGIVYVDENGNAVSPLYTWQDGRGDLFYKNGKTYAETLNSHTGYGFVTDFYNCENRLVPENAVSFCTIHDYFVMKLCGNKKPLIHISDGASFGLFNLESKNFAREVPFDFTDDFAICGEYKGIPVSVAIGDNQASVFSAISEDDVLLNYGTGSQVSVISDNAVTSENIETRPYFGGKYLLVGAALCGGRAFALLKDFYKKLLSFTGDFTDGQVYGLMDKMLTEISATSLKADTRFSGTRVSESIRGSITGISTENFTPENLTLAVVEGMVSELYGMYCEMGVKKQSIVGSGNALRKNPALIRIAEEKFGNSLKIPAHTEEAAAGAALSAAVSTKIISVENVRERIKYI